MRWVRVAVLAVLMGCWGQGQELPGEPVGTFEAVGLMVEQSCGAAISSPDPLELDFEVRAEPQGRAYWQQPAGPLFAGLKKGNAYSFQVSQSWVVFEPDSFRGYAGCSVTQRDAFMFVVEKGQETGDAGTADAQVGADAGVPASPLSLTGSQVTEITPVPGADCTPAVAANGGPFLALPCRVEYVLTGTGTGAETQ